MSQTTVDITRAAAELKEVTAEFEKVDAEYRHASRVRTITLNLLNAKQRQFAESVSAIKSASPVDSDWKQNSRRADAVEAER